VLYRDSDIASVHTAYWGPALLFRSGSYRGNRATWYRPSQAWDSTRETYVARPVPAASTVTAADLIDPANCATDASGDPAVAQVFHVRQIDLAPAPVTDWAQHLAT
jgi:hypothetical protein